MSSLNVSKMLLNLIGVAMLLPVSGFAQGQERVINKLSWRTEPIKILKLKTKGKPIELGKNFLEEDDWLKGLTVSVQNVSDTGSGVIIRSSGYILTNNHVVAAAVGGGTVNVTLSDGTSKDV